MPGFLSLLFNVTAAAAQGASGQFDDRLGQQRDFPTMYKLTIDPGPGEQDYIRATAEAAILLGIGTTWYIAKPGLNSRDWEFTTLSQKLDPSAIRFDNNVFATNMLQHPVAGAGYYGFARLNHLNIAASFAYAVAASTLWEYAFEWREKVSINDMIVTPLGGMVVGEPLVKMVQYVGSGPAKVPWLQQLARYTVGLPGTVHEWMDGRPADDSRVPTDELGFSSAYAHDFHLGYQLSQAKDTQNGSVTIHALLAESEIIAMPGFLRPGRFHLFYDEGNFTESTLRLGFSDRGLVDAALWMHTTLLGYYTQDLSSSGQRGSAYSIALAGGLTYEQRWLYGRSDELGILHALGPAADAWVTSSGFWFRMRLECSLDFASLRPAAFQRFRQLHPEGTVESVLAEQGYDYYAGASARLRLLIAYRALELGQHFSYGFYTAIGGIDRYQEKVTVNTNGYEKLADYQLWFGVTLPSTPLQFRLGFEARAHTGNTASVEVQHVEHIGSGSALLRF